MEFKGKPLENKGLEKYFKKSEEEWRFRPLMGK
jgi:hypothetical protein